jgi:hypothetical protein
MVGLLENVRGHRRRAAQGATMGRRDRIDTMGAARGDVDYLPR